MACIIQVNSIYQSNMKHIFKGCTRPVWIGNDYDLASPIMKECEFVLLDYQPWSKSINNALLLISRDKLNSYNTGECGEWLIKRDCRFLKLIPIANGLHDFANSQYCIVFHSDYDLLEFKLIWGSL